MKWNPKKNARNIPATLISCQGANAGKWAAKIPLKAFAPDSFNVTKLQRKWVVKDCKSLVTTVADPVSFAVCCRVDQPVAPETLPE